MVTNMPRKGNPYIPSKEEWERVYIEISKHRHSVKNRLIIKLCHRLGLKVNEIAKLKVKDVAMLDNRYGDMERYFELNGEILIEKNLPSNSIEINEVKNPQKRTRLSFSTDEFDKLLHEVASLAIAGEEIDPIKFYPLKRSETPLNRTLPLNDGGLRKSLSDYLNERLSNYPYLKSTDNLIISQKGGAYSPNSLQMHIAKIFGWSGLNASSSSGRRTLLVDLAHNKKVPLDVVQAVAGHKSLASTVRYKPD